MDLRFAKISNHAKNPMKPENSQAEMKGQRGVCSLVDGINIPKADGQTMPSKVNKILIESYLRRPSLKDEAIKKVFEFANNGVLVTQSPQYPCIASASAVFILKNKFVYASAGDNVIFHFVNGILTDVFECDIDEEPIHLGTPRYSVPMVSEQMTFAKGENTFLLCTKKFADSLTQDILEDTLSKATHTKIIKKHTVTEVRCDRWLKMLKDNLTNYNKDDSYSAIAFSIPPRKKKPKSVLIIIAIILALAIAFFGFGALGKMRNRPAQDGAQAGQEQQQQGMPFFPPRGQPGMQNQEGMEGQPVPPTRPPLDSENNGFFG